MILSFRHKGLKDLFETGRSAVIAPELRKRCLQRLALLNRARNLNALNVSGLDPHPLHGSDPIRYSMSVNGPWRITFEFSGRDVYRVDLEQYH